MMDALKVSVRLRPLSLKEKTSSLTSIWSCTHNSVFQSDQSGLCYYFDHVFGPQASNDEVYVHLMQEIVSQAMGGFHGTFITYGQSGSGKTYTTDALAELALDNIYGHIENCPERQFFLSISYIELYNERLSDLLATEEVALTIRESNERNISIEGLIEEGIRCKEDAFNLLAKGNEKRKFAETKLNERSSRAHCIIRIVIESRERDDTENPTIFMSHLNLVDLAGSERAGENVGERFREGCSINKSLLALSQVIRKLSEGQSNFHLSYRDSKLTRILQNALGGNSRTAIICTISPCSLDETISTLRFATNAKKVKNKPQKNEILTDAAKMMKCQREIKRLAKKISELEQAPNSQSIELEKKRDEVEHLKSLLLVSSKEPSGEKEKRRRRETVCVPQMSRYNKFQYIKGFPRTPLKPLEENSVRKDSSLVRSVVMGQQQFKHRVESPCATNSCSCQDLSFTDLEKIFIDEHFLMRFNQLREENQELRRQLRKLCPSTSKVTFSCRENEEPTLEETQEQFQDVNNISALIDMNYSICGRSNITLRKGREHHSYTPCRRTDSQADSAEISINSEQDSPYSNGASEGHIWPAELNGSLLMNQSQPLMDISVMCLNQSLLPKQSRFYKEDRIIEGKDQELNRMFDSVEMEQEFVENFESLLKERESLVQRVNKLEQQLKIKSANDIIAEGSSLLECIEQDEVGQNQSLADRREGVKGVRIDLTREFEEIEKRKAEMEPEREEMRRRAEDLKVQEERIERKIDSLCEKEEIIEDRLDAAEAKEKEVAEKESDFLRMELEFNKRRRDFEKLHDEEATKKEDSRRCNEKNNGCDRCHLMAADLKEQELNEKIYQDKSEFDRQREELADLEREIRKQEEEVIISKSGLAIEREQLDEMVADIKMWKETLHNSQSELDKEREELSEIKRDIREQEEEIDRGRSDLVRERDQFAEIASEVRKQKEDLEKDQHETVKQREELKILERDMRLQQEAANNDQEEMDEKMEAMRQMGINVTRQELEGEEFQGTYELIEEEKEVERVKFKIDCYKQIIEERSRKTREEEDDLLKQERELDRESEQLEERAKDLSQRRDEIYKRKSEMENFKADLSVYEANTTMNVEHERYQSAVANVYTQDDMCEEGQTIDQMSTLIRQREIYEEEKKKFDETQELFEKERLDLHKEKHEIEQKQMAFTEMSAQFEVMKKGILRDKEDIEQKQKDFIEMSAELEENKHGLLREKKEIENQQKKLTEMSAEFEGKKNDLLKEKEEIERKQFDSIEMSAELERMRNELLIEKEEIEIKQKEITEMSVFCEKEKLDLLKGRDDMRIEYERQIQTLSKTKEKLEEEQQKFQEAAELEVQKCELLVQKQEVEEKWCKLEEMQMCIEKQKKDIQRERNELDVKGNDLKEMAENLEKLKDDLKHEQDEIIEERRNLKEAAADLESRGNELQGENSEGLSREEDLVKIAHLKALIEKGKGILSQRNQKLAESQDNISELTKKVKALEEENSGLKTTHTANATDYGKAIEHLKMDKERAEKNVEKIKAGDSDSKEQINKLTTQLTSAEKKIKKLQVKNQEDIEYYQLALDKYKMKIRQQDLGASYIEPPENRSSYEVQSTQSELKKQEKEMQAKYTAKIVELEQTIKRLREQKDQDERKPLQNIKQEQRPPALVTSSGIVDYVVSLNKDREIRRLKKQLEKCLCTVESE